MKPSLIAKIATATFTLTCFFGSCAGGVVDAVTGDSKIGGEIGILIFFGFIALWMVVIFIAFKVFELEDFLGGKYDNRK